MSEKFRKIVSVPHKVFGRARKNIAALKPQTKKGKAGRVAGVAVTGMFQFLLWAVKYAALDNPALRNMEKGFANMRVGKNKKGEDKKLSVFAKKHPNLSSHVLYYMMMAAMIAGGNAALDKNGMHVVYDDATGKPLKPGAKAKGIPTIGFGSTRLANGKSVTSRTPPITSAEAYELARNHIEEGETYLVMYCYEVGLGIKFDDDKKAMMISSMIYNMGSSLIEEKTNLNHRNRFEELRNMFKEYGFGIPDAKVRALFQKYPVTEPTSFGKVLLGIDKSATLGDMAGLYIKAGGKLAPGLVYRRWIEAGLLSGDINPMEILDLPVAGLPEFYKMMCRDVGGDKKKAFFTQNAGGRRVNRSTYAKFHKWVKNPVDRHGASLAGEPKISDVLPTNIVAQCRSGQCQVGNMMAIINPARDSSDDANVFAMHVSKSNNKKKYKDAIKNLGNDAHSAVVRINDLNFGGNSME